MDKIDKIMQSYKNILDELKSRNFTRKDLEFIKIFSSKIVEATNKLLKKGENTNG